MSQSQEGLCEGGALGVQRESLGWMDTQAEPTDRAKACERC